MRDEGKREGRGGGEADGQRYASDMRTEVDTAERDAGPMRRLP